MRLLALFLVLATFILVSCGESEPKLRGSQMKWSRQKKTASQSDTADVLEVLEDSYKMNKIRGIRARVIGEQPVSAKSIVDWEWKVILKNKTEKELYVCIEYVLEDKNSILVSKGFEAKVFRPGETKVVQDVSSVDYSRVKDIVRGRYNLSYH